jgi:hypothetical protein
MTDHRRKSSALDWLKVILVVAVLLAVFAGTELIARQDAALQPTGPVLATELVVPAGGKTTSLNLPPVATAISPGRLPVVVARSRSSR